MEKDKLFFVHILEAAKSIEDYLRDITFGQFLEQSLSSKKTRDAVVREFEIIGEATKNLTNKVKGMEISVDWQEIVSMRNNLIHEYFGIDYEIVWQTAKEDIPKLIDAANNLLRRFKDKSK